MEKRNNKRLYFDTVENSRIVQACVTCGPPVVLTKEERNYRKTITELYKNVRPDLEEMAEELAERNQDFDSHEGNDDDDDDFFELGQIQTESQKPPEEPPRENLVLPKSGDNCESEVDHEPLSESNKLVAESIAILQRLAENNSVDNLKLCLEFLKKQENVSLAASHPMDLDDIPMPPPRKVHQMLPSPLPDNFRANPSYQIRTPAHIYKQGGYPDSFGRYWSSKKLHESHSDNIFPYSVQEPARCTLYEP
uniref:Uncharacterized protein n=2 Tax=Caenorhabditis japonica TaxID=281687 RepID=A0A8R1DRF1_CAEJA